MREFLNMLLICSATMSALGLIYMALTPLLARRYSAKSRYYAWLIIVIGLIVPFRPRLGNAIITYDLPSVTISPAVAQGNALTMAAPSEVTSLPSGMPGVSLWQIAALVWLIGMIAFVVYHTVRHYRFAKMAARWSENVAWEQGLSLLDTTKSEMGITGKIGLYQCPNVGSPMLLGLVKPRILLPQAAFPADDMAFILRHELIHYQRGDLWYKCAVLFAAAIHWFNPVIYLLVKAIDAACEVSCDAETVRNAGVDARQSYSEAIIGVVRYQSKRKTVLSTHFYGGKRGMKKRIHSIMDSGRKKAGITLLCGLLILTVAAGMAFAASTTEGKVPAFEQNSRIPSAQTASETDPSMMSRFDPETGNTSYSWDLGKTWTTLTSEEYDSMFPSPVVEWWTYDEYKVWMDEQIMALQDLADNGVPDYYDKDGVLRDFSQADVDNTTALYLSILENIKNGYRVSKSVDGLMGMVMPNNSQDITAGATEADFIVSDSGHAETGRDYSEYAPFGLSYNPRTDALYYNGELVRRLYDERTSSVVTRAFNPNGVVDITANRNEGNELIGLYKHSQQEFDERTRAMGENTSFSIAEQYAIASVEAGEEAVYDYSKYAAFGLAFDAAKDNLYYKGELVRYFEDSYPLGENMASYVNHFDENGTIDVHAIRDLSKIVYNSNGSHDPSGILTGVEPYSQAEFNARDIAQYVYDNLITQIAIGQSIEEDLRPYMDFGVSYDSQASMMMYNGVVVREIFDPQLGKLITLSGGTGFPNGAIPNGAIDLTAIYENGVLTGFQKSTREEFDLRTQNRLVTTGVVTASESTGVSYQYPTTSEASASATAGASDASWGSNPYSASATAVTEDTAGLPQAEGDTFEQIFEEYRAHGITYDPNSAMGGLGNIYYYGKLVKTFVDTSPNGGVISFSSSDGGEITIRTLYGKDGQLTGLEVTGK